MRYIFLLCFGIFSLQAMEEIKGDDSQLVQYVGEFYSCLGQKPQNIKELIWHSKENDLLSQLINPVGGSVAFNAPWREGYSTAERSEGKKAECPFCYQINNPEHNHEDYFLKRGKKAVSLLNKNGTNPLHFLVLPHKHTAKLEELADEERHELFAMAAALIKRLEEKLSVKGYNLFLNLLHRCSGASLPAHVHIQLLSRWEGDMLSLSREMAGPLIEHERSPGFFSKLSKEEWGADVQKPYEAFSKAVQANCKYTENVKCKKTHACIMCTYMNKPNADEPVLKKYKHWSVIYNQVASAPGQLFVVLNDHEQNFSDLSEEQCKEYAEIISECQVKIRNLVAPHGISISQDSGIAADHWPFKHRCVTVITPRWDNETSSMTISNGRKVVARDLGKLLGKFKQAFQ